MPARRRGVTNVCIGHGCGGRQHWTSPDVTLRCEAIRITRRQVRRRKPHRPTVATGEMPRAGTEDSPSRKPTRKRRLPTQSQIRFARALARK